MIISYNITSQKWSCNVIETRFYEPIDEQFNRR